LLKAAILLFNSDVAIINTH